MKKNIYGLVANRSLFIWFTCMSDKLKTMAYLAWNYLQQYKYNNVLYFCIK